MRVGRSGGGGRRAAPAFPAKDALNVMRTHPFALAAPTVRCNSGAMVWPMRFRRRLCACRSQLEVWKANLTLRHKWFRVLLNLCGLVLRPRKFRWFWSHITNEFHDRKPRR